MSVNIQQRYPPPPDSYDRSWADALIGALDDAEIERANAQVFKYEQAERITTERWIDGRPIWRTVVPITKAFLETNGTNIAHGISNLATVVRLSGVWNYAGTQYNLPYVNLTNAIELGVNGTNLSSQVHGAPPSWPDFVSGHVIIEYTKT